MLELEYVAEGSSDCPLLLLRGVAPEVVRALVDAMCSGTGLELHDFPGITAIDGCRVSVKVARRDAGLREIGPRTFVWERSASGWEQVAGLLEPFGSRRRERHAFQWLEKDTISFIVSTDGHW